MFYSHQLLARKAPLGQIWMAATLHAKMNRKKLDQLNIIKICEEILNPSVPMALRLSGILMGGVVIVYERKVKLLYDDLTRFLVEINEAWKVKAAPSDPTRLPKRKSQAKYEAVTLPPNCNEDLGEIEHSLQYSEGTATVGFQQTTYIAMRLDSVEDPYSNQNPQGDLNQDHHQVDAANITIFEHYDSCKADTSMLNRFERFDIDGDDETQMNFSPPEHTEIPTSLIPSPPPPDEPQKPDVIPGHHPAEQVKQEHGERMETNLQCKRRPPRKRERRSAAVAMDYDQNMIPGQIYQSWLQNTSDIVSRRGRKRKRPLDPLSTMKLPTLMELPSIVLVEKLFTNGSRHVHYPTPLFELWIQSNQPPHDSPSGRTSALQPPIPSSSSPPSARMNFMEPMQEAFEDVNVGVGSLKISIEKQRANANNGIPFEIQMEELRNNLRNSGLGVKEANGSTTYEANRLATPANSGDEIRSIPSSGSGHDIGSRYSEVNSVRSSKKRHISASKNSGNCLEPVAEEHSWQHPDPNFKLARSPTPDYELMVETGPTQTQRPITNPPLDHITNSIRMHLKTHFETPGSAKQESLNQLAFGMNKKRAACLFYQTCVLATRDYIRLEQIQPYGEILISRGPKM